MPIPEDFSWVDRTPWNKRPFYRYSIFDRQFDNLFPNSKISNSFERIRDFIASVLTKEKTSKDPQKK